MSATPIQADARNLPLADESVDLIVTSPPYFALRSYRDGGAHYEGQVGSEPTPQAFLEALWEVTKECWRVLKPTGSYFVNLGDKRSGTGGANGNTGLGFLDAKVGAVDPRTGPRNNTKQTSGQCFAGRVGDGFRGVRAKSKMLLPHRFAIGCEDGLADPDGIGWIVRQDMVWEKGNSLPESVSDRTRDSHEYWFHLTKQGRYFSAIDEIRSPAKAGTITEWNGNRGSCQRCGKTTAAGHGREVIRLLDTASSGLTDAQPSLIDSATPSTSVPSLRDSSSTTYAATEDASDPTTSKPSLSETTSSEATPSPLPTSPRLSAATVIRTTTPTLTGRQMGAECAGCVCVPETGRATGERSRNGADQPGPTGERQTAASPLGSLPPSVWRINSEPLTIPEAVKAHYDLPDHFAAFSQEWPRRLILGWSPSGVCTACGEGRRPVVGTRCRECGTLRPNNAKSCPSCGHVRAWKEGRVQEEALGSRDWSTAGHGTPRHPGNHKNRSEQDGYACACPDASAPTKPAVVVDPFGGTGTVAGVARQLGRVGVSFDLSWDYSRLAAWFFADGRRFAKTSSRTDRERQGVLL